MNFGLLEVIVLRNKKNIREGRKQWLLSQYKISRTSWRLIPDLGLPWWIGFPLLPEKWQISRQMGHSELTGNELRFPYGTTNVGSQPCYHLLFPLFFVRFSCMHISLDHVQPLTLYCTTSTPVNPLLPGQFVSRSMSLFWVLANENNKDCL